MPQPLDTSAIQRLVARARLRIRGQWALEGATTASILASALWLVAIFLMPAELVEHTTGVVLIAAGGAIIVAAAALCATRKLDDELVARRIDRASNLSDRLSTAIAFQRSLAQDKVDPDTTHDLMVAAIVDGVRAAPRANLKAAAPFTAPKEL